MDLVCYGLEKAPAGDRKEAGPAGYEFVRRQLEALFEQQWCLECCCCKHRFAQPEASRCNRKQSLPSAWYQSATHSRNEM